ncbi:hypothetical protein [Streptomyces sp. NBC_01408]|uniref:hypothetical protein n=1 Tax=Streptomyces sp. NBC_01408 TaxID=2903855 RepID=UPI00224CBED0|nr:hypothetical protein [Streptomyces sp. NBC_01408]MCX4692870.1 hypothetical protein [Streptomyces sp. NBC_01408]
MSEIADTPVPVSAAGAPVPAPDVQTVHEAYSFACMRCGYGWEQAYAIEHHVDAAGRPFIMYTVKGERVPSPLSNLTCLNCGGHVVRIMRAGQVSSVLGMLDQLYHYPVAPGIAGPVPAGANVPRTPKPRRATPRHDAPGPVAIDADEERRGLLSRLLGIFRRS